MPFGSIQAHYLPVLPGTYVFPRNWWVRVAMATVGLRDTVCCTAQPMLLNGGAVHILLFFFGFLGPEFILQYTRIVSLVFVVVVVFLL